MPSDLVEPENHKKIIQIYAKRAIKKDWKQICSEVSNLLLRAKDVNLVSKQKLETMKKHLEQLNKDFKNIK